MIVSVPNPVLTTKAKTVEKIDKKVLEIIDEMKNALIATVEPKGVGLAAPQMGIPLRIFIIRPKEDSPIDVFINPEIVWRSNEVSELEREEGKGLKKEKKLEGCLSIPGIWGHLKRAKKVRLKFMNTEGKWEEKEFTGFTGTIIQHETDHLNGILFTQRVLEQKEKMYEIVKDDKGEESLEEIEL